MENCCRFVKCVLVSFRQFFDNFLMQREIFKNPKTVRRGLRGTPTQ